jgi:hypothetical protein
MTSGVLGIAALIVGSSTISQLGSMDPTSCRFLVAVACLIVATALCWIPFILAVSVLRSDVVSLQKFALATGGQLKTAADAVEGLLGQTLPGAQENALVSMWNFSRDFHIIRRAAWDRTPDDRNAADKALAYIDELRDISRDACITELVAVRFNCLIWDLGLTGPLILLLFLTATWAANPAKGESVLAEKPRLEKLGAAQVADLTAAKIGAACLGPGAQLVSISTPESRLQTMILIPPLKVLTSCETHKVIQSWGGGSSKWISKALLSGLTYERCWNAKDRLHLAASCENRLLSESDGLMSPPTYRQHEPHDYPLGHFLECPKRDHIPGNLIGRRPWAIQLWKLRLSATGRRLTRATS